MKLTKFLKNFGDNSIFPKDIYPGSVFDDDSSVILKIIGAVVMFGIIGFVFAGILAIFGII
jgi:hypothetical protein